MTGSTKNKTLDRWLSRKKKNSITTAIVPMSADQSAPLSRGQERLWLLQQLYPDNPFYQYAHAYRFKGSLNIEVLLSSFQLVAQRHSILRTTFVEKENQVVQEIKSEAKIPTEVIDLQNLTVEKQAESIQKITQEKANQIFDLKKDSLLRVTVLVLNEREHYVLLSMHHIIGDRWSLQVLNKELAATYQELLTNSNATVEPLEIQYADYAYWQRSQKEKPEDLEHWLQHLSGELPVLALPTDSQRPSQPSFQGISTTKIISSQLSNELKALCKKQNTTPYVVLLAAYQILLHRYTGQKEILVGTPFSNRDKKVLEKLVGFFNETLVLKTDLSDDPTFVELVDQVKTTTAKALQHKSTPFDTLVRTLKPERNGTANPLFQVMFLFNEIQETPAFAEGLVMEESVVDLGVSKFDLTLFVTDKGENLTVTFEYATDLFEADTIERLHQNFEVLLKSIVADPSKSIAELPLLSETEQTKILKTWNQTEAALSNKENVLSLFEKNVKETPEATCVVFENDQLTYQEVNTRAEAIAKGLQAKGIGANMPVGLHLNRSVDLAVGIIAILKAGGAYLPLDPEYPTERIEYMVQDAAVKVILTQKEISNQLPKSQATHLTFEEAEDTTTHEFIRGEKTTATHEFIRGQSAGDDLAYIIYTSGSTGKPKGVPITHENLMVSTSARFHFYEKNPSAFLLLSSYSFDSSVAGIFWALTTGGALVVSPKRIEQDIDGLADLISKNQISHTLMLPSLYDLLLEHASAQKLGSLHTIMVAGEACASTVVKRHFETLPNAKLYNEYGPTEGTVWCTAHQILEADANGTVPIGRPIPNVKNFILNHKQQPVPIGVAGELYIGGDNLSKGYLHRPELTDEKFITTNFGESQEIRLYKTGDLARFRANGVIEFLGRADQQVKIRGHRIELNEIREVLRKQKGVREAAVLVQTEGNQKRLVGYLSHSNELTIADLRTNLKQELPNYMVPSVLVELDEFPRLPNGKINFSSLLPPNETAFNRTAEFAAPEGSTEQTLTSIWEEVLKIKPISRHDNFFDIGGDSILSIQIVAKARQADLSLAANQIFEYQTIAELAASIVNQTQKSTFKISDLPEIDQSQFPLSFMQQAFLLHHLKEKEDQGFLQLEFSLRGKIDPQIWERAWSLTAERHPILRTAIEWDQLKKPIQRVHPDVVPSWNFLDWTSLSKGQQFSALEHFKKEDKAQFLDLSAAPIGRFTLIQVAKNRSLFIWTCHHIILDGWSGGILVKEALNFYKKIQKKEEVAVAPIPTYASFLDWSERQDQNEAETYWKNTFAKFKTPTLFGHQVEATSIDFQTSSFSISKETSDGLNSFARKNKLTSNSLLKGIWGLLLSRFFGQKDLAFGSTVSGRFADFPNIEEMAGLFMNVLPTRVQVDSDLKLTEWLVNFQKEQTAANAYDRSNLEEINGWINWQNQQPLFDSLFVFGNFMKDGLEVGELRIDDFQGGFTSTYPLTIRVNPTEAIQFDLRYDQGKISNTTIDWFQKEWINVLELISHSTEVSFESIFKIIAPTPFKKEITQVAKTITSDPEKYVAPTNPIELQLTKIWEGLFSFSPIGIHDNFFEIGGKSLLAMRLFGKIEEEMSTVLPPTTLIQNPTIKKLAEIVSGDAKLEAWSTVVPMRASGSKAPLFCIHAGGAHVFFYEGLTKHLSIEQPVYAIQPKGLDGKQTYHTTIEEMATNYISEVKKVQPEGPYHLLGHCFSNAVCLEMANQLEQAGERVSMIIIDSAPAHLIPLEKKKPVARFFRILADANWSLLYRKLRRRFFIIKKQVAPRPESEAEQQLNQMIRSLNSVYAAYSWKPFNGKVVLIRSSQFAEKEGKNFHLKQWEKLSKKLEVHVVTGRHLTIFEEPSVVGLAKKIEESLDLEKLKK